MCIFKHLDGYLRYSSYNLESWLRLFLRLHFWSLLPILYLPQFSLELAQHCHLFIATSSRRRLAASHYNFYTISIISFQPLQPALTFVTLQQLHLSYVHHAHLPGRYQPSGLWRTFSSARSNGGQRVHP